MGKIAREQFDRRVRNLNTRMRSLELDRDQIQSELELKRVQLELKRTELEQAQSELQKARSQDRELVVVFGQDEDSEMPRIEGIDSELTRVKGIGPKIAAILMTEGIETTQDLAALTDNDLDRLAARWPGLVTRMTRERWREAASSNGAGEHHPVKERPIEEEPVEAQPVEEQPVEQEPVEERSVEQRLETHKPADHPRRRTPEDVPIEVEEPDAVVSPDLEYPPVRFG